jgi:hypothetical protein
VVPAGPSILLDEPAHDRGKHAAGNSPEQILEQSKDCNSDADQRNSANLHQGWNHAQRARLLAAGFAHDAWCPLLLLIKFDDCKNVVERISKKLECRVAPDELWAFGPIRFAGRIFHICRDFCVCRHHRNGFGPVPRTRSRKRTRSEERPRTTRVQVNNQTHTASRKRAGLLQETIGQYFCVAACFSQWLSR